MSLALLAVHQSAHDAGAGTAPNPYEVPGCQETNYPMSGFFLFSAYRVWRSRQSVSCSDVISMCRCQPSAAAPHTYGGSVATLVASAEHRWGYPLRPSNNVVPSYRPMQRGG